MPEAEPPPPPVAIASPRRDLWLEVMAVLAVGVIPSLVNAISSLAQPPGPPLPYWLDTLQLTVTSGCAIFVTLYIIHRSGESMPHFGIVRLNGWDAPLALILLLVSEGIWFVMSDVLVRVRYSEESHTFFPHPHGLAEHLMMTMKYLVSASAEEILMRAYLITRLKVLLRSRTEAVLIAAILFASYHSYQGLIGVIYSLAFGLAYGVAFLLIGRVWPLAFAHALYDMRVDMMTG